MSMKYNQAKVCLQGDGGVADTKTVTAAGTAECLVASSTRVQCVTIAPLPTNTDSVGISFLSTGTVADNSYVMPTLTGGAVPIKINIDDLEKLYVDVNVNGEGVSYLAETDSTIINPKTRRTTY